MFEERTYEAIMEEMLDTVEENTDTRQGSVIYDAVAPTAMENAQMYVDMDILLDETFADTASYYYLTKRAAERGISPRKGTPAALKVRVEPENVEIPAGAKFNVGELNYTLQEKLDSSHYSLLCDEVGVMGNNTGDQVIPMEEVYGLEYIEVAGIIKSGTDDEDVEELRKRYFDSFDEAAFGGNRAEYKERTNEMDSVFGCKVYPVWNGGGTVKLVILGEDYGQASAEVVAKVQEAIDPTKDGSGAGIAPIGHVVTVETVSEQPIDINCQIEYKEGYTWEEVEPLFTQAVGEYLLQLRKDWEEADGLVVRMGRLESLLLDISGVQDVTSISICGVSHNYVLSEGQVPIVGEIHG